MKIKDELIRLQKAIERELHNNILPFWLGRTVDQDHGGFYGRIANDGTVDARAEKGLILNTRILWTFSRLFSESPNPNFEEMAQRAYRYLVKYFWDRDYPGTYWMLDYTGRPIDSKKKTYGQAFTVYALSEYASALHDNKALDKAITLYTVLEEKARDEYQGGYLETFERDWEISTDQRLSEVDMNEKKSMNTHLHVLEAYGNLLAVWNDPGPRQRLAELLNIFLRRIIDPATWHFRLFFAENWECRSDGVSFGHDIEGSWLLCEAAQILNEPLLLKSIRQTARMMARAVLDEGIDKDGGLLYESEGGEISDDSKHWWPQAEAVVGFLNAYELTGEEDFLTAAIQSWEFIERHIVDRQNGEWFWKVSRDGVPSQEKFKVDPWKGPYHNTRACLEAIARLKRLQQRYA